VVRELVAERGLNPPGILEKHAPPGYVFDLPGRGVLRFSARGYRNSVHFLAKIAIFSKNSQI